jgi:phage recombination protein Bet
MNEIAVKGSLTPDQIELITRTLCKGATPDELQLFISQCNRTGLDPLSRQIYAIKRWDSQLQKNVMGIQVSIDGFRLIAERTKELDGQETFWCGTDGQWVDVWLNKEAPSAAKAVVYRKGCSKPFIGIAKFDSYKQLTKEGNLTQMWAKMPDLMIAKCAESLALRKAFPQELSGLYTAEEMAQASNPIQEEVIHIAQIESNEKLAPKEVVQPESELHSPKTIAAKAKASDPLNNKYLNGKWKDVICCFGKKTGPLRGKKLGELQRKDLAYLRDNYKATPWNGVISSDSIELEEALKAYGIERQIEKEQAEVVQEEPNDMGAEQSWDADPVHK